MATRQPTDETSAELTRLRLEIERLERDNTELRARARFDEQLGSDAARYEVIVANLAAGVVLQRADGQILACNAAAERILGLSVEQMAGRSSLDPRWRSIHEDGAAFPGETHPAMVSLRTGLPIHDVIMGVHKPDGGLTWISINSEPLFVSGHAKPHAVVTSFVDITTLKRSEERARESEDKLRFALLAARMGTWDWDIQTNEVRWSDNVEAMVGLPPGGFAQTYEAYVELVHPEDRGAFTGAVARAVDGTDPSDDFVNEHRVVGADGRIRWLGAFGRVIRDEHNLPVRMAGTISDISTRKALENQLLLSQRMETVGRLAGGVAHDFNNLLTAILGCTDLAELNRDLPPDVREALDTIREASEKAADLTRQLLSFARRQVLDLEILDLRALILDLDRLLSRVIGDHIQVRTTLPAAAVPIRADQAQVEQVLVNLAVNARDAMPGGGQLDIELSVEPVEATPAELVPSGTHALLRLRDTGCGIAKADLARVFDPFFTTKAEGTGLGLATCYGIVKQIGGEILVDSEPGRGTQFSIYLPLSSEPVGRKTPRARPAPPRGRGRILLAEDDAVVRLIAERGLRAHGYEVLAAADGEAALELLGRQSGEFDLLVSDLVMPNMTGQQLAEQLRERHPALRVLFVSGYAEGVLDREDARRGIADAVYLAKPYTMARLLEVVGQLLAS